MRACARKSSDPRLIPTPASTPPPFAHPNHPATQPELVANILALAPQLTMSANPGISFNQDVSSARRRHLLPRLLLQLLCFWFGFGLRVTPTTPSPNRPP